MTKKSQAPEERTFIMELKNGNIRKMTMPAGYKATFGNVLPYEGKDKHHGEHRIALRLYEGNKENLRAVMTDVVCFRDASIKVMEKRTETRRKAAKTQTPQGMRDVVVEATMTEWVDPDNEKESSIPNEFLSLPGSIESEDDQ